MRRSPLAVALALVLAPTLSRGQTSTDPVDVQPSDLTPEQASARAAAADSDARAAAAARMALPAGVQAEREQAHAAVAAQRAGLPRFGLAVGGGFPDLATASVLFRPIPSVRFFAGPEWGYVGWGVQGGVVVAPRWSVAPTLSLEGGKLFRSDLGFLAKDKGGVPEGIKPLLRRIDYQYVALDVGLELGSPSSLAFFLRLGLAYVSVKANGTATYTTDSGTKVSFTDPAISGTLPSVKLGLQYWF